MCGIFGIFNSNGQIYSSQLKAATTAIRHRGPDDEGYLLANTQTQNIKLFGGDDADGGKAAAKLLNLPRLTNHEAGEWNLAFGFRRLAILDVSPSGHQPMSNRAQTVWLIFNGEIYNYVELRDILAKKGYTFSSTGDTNVILAAYEEWGSECVKHFVGMWGLAILDLRDAHAPKLFVSRDPFGIKPLYYTVSNGQIAFGSEIKALLELPWVSRRANPQRLHDYLRIGYLDHDDNKQHRETMFADVYQLRPAHSITLDLTQSVQLAALHPQHYWKLDPKPRHDLSFNQAADHLREIFLKNVRLHLRSDVPVGTALSGGIDSSAIVMGMRHIEPNIDLRTFSFIAQADPAINEERWSDLIVQASRAKATKTSPDHNSLVADLMGLVKTQDEPVGSTSIYAQYCVFRLARENGMKVMLDGQGADELLAGYRGYRAIRLASLLRKRQFGAAMQFQRGLKAYAGEAGWGSMALRVASEFLPRQFYNSALRLAGKDSSASFLNTNWFNQHQISPLIPAEAGKTQNDLLRFTLIDASTSSNLPALLHYEDRNSMAHSIESRVPFLTTEIAEFILSLPEDYLISSDGTTKCVFRQAMRGLVPDTILDRKDKIGFSTPERQWLGAMKTWIAPFFSGDTAQRVAPLHLPYIQHTWEAIVNGSQTFDWRVWRWVNVIAWSEMFGVNYD